MSACYSYSINCAPYIDLYGCMESCDMLPLPPIPRRGQCGMPLPALTRAWAHVWPRAWGLAQAGVGPGPFAFYEKTTSRIS